MVACLLCRVMVTKEQLVITKDQAVRLRQLGVGQKSLFAWTKHIDKHGELFLLDDNLGDGWAAFTVPEMIDLLPKMGKIKWFFFVLRTGLIPSKIGEYLIGYAQMRVIPIKDWQKN